MRSNKMAKHIDDLSAEMREHRDVMVDSFSRFLPDAIVRAPQGGYFLWAELPGGSDAAAIAARAVELGVEVSDGRLCFPNDDTGNHLRLAYSIVSPEEIRAGVEMLGRAYDDWKASS